MQSINADKSLKYFSFLLLISLLSNGLGLFNEILEPDGALYASISKNIVERNDWVNLYAYGGDWLDKPHFPFWITALSFKVFGISAFTYKLPSFLCFLIGVFYTYKLATILFSKYTAEFATLIYATSLHVILSNFDVRAEGYLTAFIIASIYHLLIATENNWLKHIFLASLFAALAIMTKGIFVLITICSGFVIYWILNKDLKQFLKVKWHLFFILTFVFILPELYALYHQFDLHPEKLVFGKTNISGLKFFFWDSQFGRFFNTGPIQGSGDIFFFVHSTLWAFLPWSIALLSLIYLSIVKRKIKIVDKHLIISIAALISFLLFSVSQFQLPHYIIIIFPLLSIIVANYIVNIESERSIKFNIYLQNFIYFILIVLIAILNVFFQIKHFFILLLLTIVITQLHFFIFKGKTKQNIILKAICFSIMFSIFFNGFFYPQLMQYQAGMVAGKWQKNNYPTSTIQQYRTNVFSLDFYGKTTGKLENEISNCIKKESNYLLFSSKVEIEKINTDSFRIQTLKWFPYFHITELNAKFINHKTRNSTLDSFAIIKVGLK